MSRAVQAPALLTVGLAAVLAVSGCGSPAGPVAGAHAVAVPSIRPVLPSAPPPAAIDELQASPAAGDSPAGPLPDRDLTPGAVFADVTTAQVCRPHYTAGVRRPRVSARLQAFARYDVQPAQRARYELDHLVPLALGGSNAAGNLWPQAYGGPRGAEHKDALEDHLRDLVCGHRLGLRTAQGALRRDWWATYRRFPPGAVARTAAAVVNAGPCGRPGQTGATSRGVQLTCRATTAGLLRWRKRG